MPTSTTPDGLAPGTRIGNYRLVRRLADGGMGSVHEASHVILPRRVALKVMRRELASDADAFQRMLQEACLLESLGHPGVVRVFECGVLDDHRPWMAMEMIEGPTLCQHMDVGHKLPVDEVLRLLSAITDVLVTAHAGGVVHRDLKPDNILLTASAPGVKLIDWGIARVPDGRPRITHQNLALGTPTYIAPEQARGLDVDGRADIYALGVIAFEMLAGETPFRGNSAIELVIQHLTAPPPVLTDLRDDVPAALIALIEAMLAKDVDQRPDAHEVRRLLHPIAHSTRDDGYVELTIVRDDDMTILDGVLAELSDDVILLDRVRRSPHLRPVVVEPFAVVG